MIWLSDDNGDYGYELVEEKPCKSMPIASC